eukprot:TRINITY_DN21302_c0_g1_i1.p1 TRINITY_DN21302_c0_g1~~TRINITY_DN21302_c0_g1_i1.p1  ORF type:complete len:101 (+),score=18.57 TRINITY_DN21302_c0_g1_i1:71-373(+)
MGCCASAATFEENGNTNHATKEVLLLDAIDTTEERMTPLKSKNSCSSATETSLALLSAATKAVEEANQLYEKELLFTDSEEETSEIDSTPCSRGFSVTVY